MVVRFKQLFFPALVRVGFTTVFWLAVWVQKAQFKLYLQPPTSFHFLAARQVIVSCCLHPQGEEALVLRKCFEGVQRDGEVIWVRDTVLLRSGPRKKSLPYVAKISAFWEDPESGGTHADRFDSLKI